MSHKLEKHRDKRGTIEDLKVGKDWSVTYITFKKGAIRGNHYHKKTAQYDVLLSGAVLCRHKKDGEEYKDTGMFPGGILAHQPGVSHAYKAIEDSEMVSICKGVRIGENYEEDTFRLENPLI